MTRTKKNIHVLYLGEDRHSPRTSQRNQAKTFNSISGVSSKFTNHVKGNSSISGKIPKLRARSHRHPRPPGPAIRRQDESEKIDSSSKDNPCPRDRSTGSNLQPTLQGPATKVGSSDELAAELPRSRSETEAGIEHSIEILAGWPRGSVLKPGFDQPLRRLRPTPFDQGIVPEVPHPAEDRFDRRRLLRPQEPSPYVRCINES